MKSLRLDTLLIHAGEHDPRTFAGAAVTPIFQSVTFSESAADPDQEWLYSRPADTPNHQVLGRKLATLEGTEDAVVAASGMAAISSALFALLRPGDHLLTQGAVYGGTYEVIHHELAELGITHTTVDTTKPDTWAAALTPATKVFYVEAISNPLAEMGDLCAVAAFCRAHGLASVIDNTFATPVLLRPAADLGFEVVLESATKYLNGHSDVLAGVVAGRADFIRKVRDKMRRFGGTLDPHACFLLQRGMRTLGLRVRRASASALALAAWLDAQPQVASVRYPGLPTSPHHAYAKQLLGGSGGGVFAFEVAGGLRTQAAFLKALRLPLNAPSLGGVETLVSVPATSSHAELAPEDRKAVGVSDELIRVAVGIEDTEDLLADFQQALAAAAAAGPAANGIVDTKPHPSA